MGIFTGQSVDTSTVRQVTEGVAFGLQRSGASCETFNRRLAGSAISLTTANAVYTAIYLTAGTVVTNITFCSSTTALATGTHQLAGLFDSSFNQLATSADGTSGAWSASSEKTFAMTTPYTVTADGLFYVGIAVVASTTPTLAGLAQATVALNALAPAVAFVDSSNTISTALPATATKSAGNGAVYAYIT